MPKQPEPLALRAVIAPTATAIRVGGQDGECIRLTLDVYEDAEVVAKLMELRGKELVIELLESG